MEERECVVKFEFSNDLVWLCNRKFKKGMELSKDILWSEWVKVVHGGREFEFLLYVRADDSLNDCGTYDLYMELVIWDIEKDTWIHSDRVYSFVDNLSVYDSEEDIWFILRIGMEH